VSAARPARALRPRDPPPEDDHERPSRLPARAPRRRDRPAARRLRRRRRDAPRQRDRRRLRLQRHGRGDGPTPANDEIDVEELHLGRALKPDSTVAEDTDDFRTGDTIWAVMETDANESGKQVVVRWTMDDGDQIVHEEPRMVATGDKARTVFRGKAGGWAPGKYHVRIMYNGKETKSAEFEVK
jgi:hypothetical protein